MTTTAYGDLAIDYDGLQAILDGEVLPLTKVEFTILAMLAQSPRRAFTREQIADVVWGRSWFGDLHMISVHISNLRHKLGESAAQQRHIRTVRGVGYKFEPFPGQQPRLAAAGHPTRASQDGSPVVVLHYGADMSLVGIDAPSGDVFGWAPDDIRGTFLMLRTVRSVGLDRALMLAMLHQMVDAGMTHWRRPTEIFTAAGEPRMVETDIAVEVRDGRFAGMTAQFRNADRTIDLRSY